MVAVAPAIKCDRTCHNEQRWPLERICCALQVLKRQQTIEQASVVLRVISAQIGRGHALAVQAAWKARE